MSAGNAGPLPQAGGSPDAPATPAPPTPSTVDLPRGEALELSEAPIIMGATPTRVVVLGGPHDSGKTTLICSIYERFRREPFAGLVFSGSRTLFGFERASHLGRCASGLPSPETERTSLKMSRRMFHLRLYDGNCSSHHNLLLTDLSGEEFENVRNYTDACRELTIIARADHFVLLVDGKKLQDIALRQQARDETDTILRRLVETGMLGIRSRVDILFSKWDLIEQDPAGSRAKDFAATVETQLRERFAQYFAKMRFAPITARRPDGLAPPASGVEGLLPSWCRESRLVQRVPKFSVEGKSNLREFDRFVDMVR